MLISKTRPTLTDDSTLELSSVLAQCLTNAHIGLQKRHVANIIGARDVTIEDGSLVSDNNVETEAGETQFTTITGRIADVATSMLLALSTSMRQGRPEQP